MVNLFLFWNFVETSGQMKKDLRKLSLEQIKDWLTQNNEPAFRAKQVMEWLWQKSVVDIDEMSNLSKALTLSLKQLYNNETMRNLISVMFTSLAYTSRSLQKAAGAF